MNNDGTFTPTIVENSDEEINQNKPRLSQDESNTSTSGKPNEVKGISHGHCYIVGRLELVKDADNKNKHRSYTARLLQVALVKVNLT